MYLDSDGVDSVPAFTEKDSSSSVVKKVKLGCRSSSSVLAVAVVADISYGKAFHAYRSVGRFTGKGTHRATQQMVLKKFNVSVRLDRDKTYGYEGKTLNNVLRDCKHWTGRYLVYVRGHVLAIRDGICEDWTAEGSRRRVTDIYKVS